MHVGSRPPLAGFRALCSAQDLGGWLGGGWLDIIMSLTPDRPLVTRFALSGTVSCLLAHTAKWLCEGFFCAFGFDLTSYILEATRCLSPEVCLFCFIVCHYKERTSGLCIFFIVFLNSPMIGCDSVGNILLLLCVIIHIPVSLVWKARLDPF